MTVSVYNMIEKLSIIYDSVESFYKNTKGRSNMRIYAADEFMNANRHIYICKCSVGSVPHSELPHTHEFIEIVYILSGKMIHLINGQEYHVKQGDILFMNCGCTHEFLSGVDYTYVNILFAPERINTSILAPANSLPLLFLSAFDDMTRDMDFGKISFHGVERKELEDIIFSMLREYDIQLTSWETVLENYLNTLIVKMLRKIEIGISLNELDDVWRELSEYIDYNLNTKLTGDALARKFFYNPSYFSRVFKEKFGMTFMEYVTRKRLSSAVDLLKNTDLSIDEIGQLTGFPNSNSLYRAFNNYLDHTPSYYRNSKK